MASASAALPKKSVRSHALRQREGMMAHIRHEKDASIIERLRALPEYKAARRILLYASYKSEVHTHELVELAVADGKEVYLPKVQREGNRLTKHRVRGMCDVAPGYWGIPEPTTAQCVRVEEIDLVVVPGAAFDPTGARVGYGGGYYDRLLPRVKGRRPLVALAYEEQVLDQVPSEQHDIRMDIIVTDRRVIRCG